MSNFTNYTDFLTYEQTWDISSVLGLAAMTLVVAVGVPGNILLIISVLRRRDLRLSPTFIILTSQAFGDILLLLACGSSISYMIIIGKKHALFCKAYNYVLFCSTCISLSHLLAFSVLRFFILVKPFFAQRHITSKKIVRICGIIWMGMLAAGLVLIEPGTVENVLTPDNTTFSRCVVKGISKVTAITGLIGCFLPIGLIVGFHVAKLRKLRQNKIQSANVNALGRRQEVSSWIVFAILLTLLLTWLPAAFFHTLIVLFGVGISANSEVIYTFLHILMFSNSMMNPYLYFFVSCSRRNQACCSVCMKESNPQ